MLLHFVADFLYVKLLLILDLSATTTIIQTAVMFVTFGLQYFEVPYAVDFCLPHNFIQLLLTYGARGGAVG